MLECFSFLRHNANKPWRNVLRHANVEDLWPDLVHFICMIFFTFIGHIMLHLKNMNSSNLLGFVGSECLSSVYKGALKLNRIRNTIAKVSIMKTLVFTRCWFIGHYMTQIIYPSSIAQSIYNTKISEC